MQNIRIVLHFVNGWQFDSTVNPLSGTDASFWFDAQSSHGKLLSDTSWPPPQPCCSLLYLFRGDRLILHAHLLFAHGCKDFLLTGLNRPVSRRSTGTLSTTTLRESPGPG